MSENEKTTEAHPFEHRIDRISFACARCGGGAADSVHVGTPLQTPTAQSIADEFNRNVAGKNVGTLQPVAVASTSAEDRREKLGAYFRQFLTDWMSRLMDGIRMSPPIAMELAGALIEAGTAVAISTDDKATVETDEETHDRAEIAMTDLIVRLVNEHMLLRHGEGFAKLDVVKSERAAAARDVAPDVGDVDELAPADPTSHLPADAPVHMGYTTSALIGLAQIACQPERTMPFDGVKVTQKKSEITCPLCKRKAGVPS